MQHHIFKALTLAMALFFLLGGGQDAHAARSQQAHKNAVVLAMFGTTVEPALKALLAVRQRMEQRFPQTTVRLAFTSNIIRRIWQQRATDPQYRLHHPEVPEEILSIRGPLATMALLQDQGFDTLVVQPTHILPGEEFHDLANYIKALAGIETIKEKYRPFHKVVLGRPALGASGPRHPYAQDIETAARVLAVDAELARKNDAALVYMGHGNEHFPTGGIYLEMAARMRALYPNVLTVIGCVEGYPSFQEVLRTLRAGSVRRVLLKPFMVVAGNHAMVDMIGPDEDSWQSMLEREGIQVIPVRQGLGELSGFADIFVEHAADAAKDAGITLQ